MVDKLEHSQNVVGMPDFQHRTCSSHQEAELQVHLRRVLGLEGVALGSDTHDCLVSGRVADSGMQDAGHVS